MAIVAICLTTCSSNNDVIDEPVPEQQESYEICLGLGGEYVDVSEEPLTRTDEPKKYYAINVYCMKTDGTEYSYSKYACGIFDNKEDMKITLLGGYRYKFECTSATEGEDKFYFEYSYLYWPCRNQENINSINRFVTNNSIYYSLKRGNTVYELDNYNYNYKYRYYNYPKMDRYYGELTDYLPTAGGRATIPMKRTVFGVKMIINGVPDGKLSWSQENLRFNPAEHSGSDILEFSSTYTFYEVYECWQKVVSGEVYTQNFTINFNWVRSNGYTQEFSKEITVKRNVMTTANVTLTGGSEEVGVGIEEENEEMSNETVDASYDGGNMNDIEVNPEE